MWTPDIGWVMYLSKLQRMNTGPSEQLAKFGRTGLSVQWLYQLFLALECDVWIGTRNSNWNRLIDEMRCALRTLTLTLTRTLTLTQPAAPNPAVPSTLQSLVPVCNVPRALHGIMATDLGIVGAVSPCML